MILENVSNCDAASDSLRREELPEGQMIRLLGLAFLLCAAGCQTAPKEGGGATTKAAKTYRIAFVPKMGGNPILECSRIAAKHRAKEMGNVEILWRAPVVFDPSQQAQVIEALIKEKVDGMAIDCTDAEVLRESIDRAVAAGIPTICFTSDSPRSKRKYFFGTDDIKAGEILAREMARLIGGKGEIAMLSGDSGAPNLQLRLKAARDYFARYCPEVKVVNILYCEGNVLQSVNLIRTYMAVSPDLAGWLMVGAWPLFDDQGLDPIDPAKTKVVAFDSLPPEWRCLESGKCQALVADDYWGWGETSLNIVMKMIEGKEWEGAGPNGIIACTNDVITKDNLPAYKQLWRDRFGEVK